MNKFYPVINFEGRYGINENGVIWSNKRNKPMTRSVDKDGYYKIHLYDGKKLHNCYLHRLLAIQFIEGQTKINNQVNHINGIKSDNNLQNLEWVSNKENRIHAFKLGLQKGRPGEKHHNVKLKEEDIHKIRDLLKTGLSTYKIAALYSVSQSQIFKIKKGIRWTHI